MSVHVCVCVCVCVCVFFLYLCLCSSVRAKNKKLKCVSCDAQLSAAGPCVHTLGPKNSKQSIAWCQESLKSTVYDFAGPLLKDLWYSLYSLPPIDSVESTQGTMRHVSVHTLAWQSNNPSSCHLGCLCTIQLCHPITARLQHVTLFYRLYGGPRTYDIKVCVLERAKESRRNGGTQSSSSAFSRGSVDT